MRGVLAVILSAAKDLSLEEGSDCLQRGHLAVILSAAKDLSVHRARPFAEFTLSGANVLRACLERSEGVTGIISKCLVFGDQQMAPGGGAYVYQKHKGYGDRKLSRL